VAVSEGSVLADDAADAVDKSDGVLVGLFLGIVITGDREGAGSAVLTDDSCCCVGDALGAAVLLWTRGLSCDGVSNL
jgi:hypothetical protein